MQIAIFTSLLFVVVIFAIFIQPTQGYKMWFSFIRWLVKPTCTGCSGLCEVKCKGCACCFIHGTPDCP